MEQRPVKNMATLEAECEEYKAQIRAYKKGGAEPDIEKMMTWSGDIVVHVMNHVKYIAANNMTAPFVIAALRVVADTVENSHSDTEGLRLAVAMTQEVLSHSMTAVHIRVPNVEGGENGADDE